MARHTIQIPINKSSNDRWLVTGYGDPMEVPAVSRDLYFGQNCRMGVGWDNELIPKDKKIIEVKLNLYAHNSLNRGMVGKFTEFGEGGDLPPVAPNDVSFSNISSGWNAYSIPEPPIGSLVFHAAYSSPPYDYVTFSSSRASSNKPYISVVYDDIPPDPPTSLYPSGITVNPRDVIRFAWEHNSKENNQQKGFTLQYSTNGGSTWTTINQTTPNQFYDMPANTLPTTGTALWRVRTIDGNDEISNYTTASFILGVVPQQAPIPISPISQYIDENKPVKFEWSFLGGSPGETQSKFTLQYSTNGGSTWTTKTVTTSDEYYELPAGTFSGGNITWRVRTYNNWNEVSPYSENKTFTVIGSPPIPLISNVTNSARPLITWQSTDQHIYELQVLKGNEVIFDTGSIPSTTDRSIKLPIYLQDGTYKVVLRIFNEYNLPSPWAEKTFIISTTKPNKPIMEIYSGEYGVTIRTLNTSNKTLVYRDGKYIGEVENNHFVDYTGENNKEYRYFVRTINSNDNFADSEIKLAKCNFKGNTLALAKTPSKFIKLEYGFGDIPRKIERIGNNGGLVYFDGRKYPVVEFSEFKERSKTVQFILKTKEKLLELIKLIDMKETLLYRDVDGDNIYGIVLAIDFEKNIFGYYNISFTIVKTDYKDDYYD